MQFPREYIVYLPRRLGGSYGTPFTGSSTPLSSFSLVASSSSSLTSILLSPISCLCSLHLRSSYMSSSPPYPSSIMIARTRRHSRPFSRTSPTSLLYLPRRRRHSSQATPNRWHPEKQMTRLITLWSQDGSAGRVASVRDRHEAEAERRLGLG